MKNLLFLLAWSIPLGIVAQTPDIRPFPLSPRTQDPMITAIETDQYLYVLSKQWFLPYRYAVLFDGKQWVKAPFQSDAPIDKVVSDGKEGFWISGAFQQIDGLPRPHLAHLNADFSLDKNWTVPAFPSDGLPKQWQFYQLLQTPDHRIILDFNHISQKKQQLWILDAQGTSWQALGVVSGLLEIVPSDDGQCWIAALQSPQLHLYRLEASQLKEQPTPIQLKGRFHPQLYIRNQTLHIASGIEQGVCDWQCWSIESGKPDSSSQSRMRALWKDIPNEGDFAFEALALLPDNTPILSLSDLESGKTNAFVWANEQWACILGTNLPSFFQFELQDQTLVARSLTDLAMSALNADRSGFTPLLPLDACELQNGHSILDLRKNAKGQVLAAGSFKLMEYQNAPSLLRFRKTDMQLDTTVWAEFRKWSPFVSRFIVYENRFFLEEEGGKKDILWEIVNADKAMPTRKKVIEKPADSYILALNSKHFFILNYETNDSLEARISTISWKGKATRPERVFFPRAYKTILRDALWQLRYEGDHAALYRQPIPSAAPERICTIPFYNPYSTYSALLTDAANADIYWVVNAPDQGKIFRWDSDQGRLDSFCTDFLSSGFLHEQHYLSGQKAFSHDHQLPLLRYDLEQRRTEFPLYSNQFEGYSLPYPLKTGFILAGDFVDLNGQSVPSGMAWLSYDLPTFVPLREVERSEFRNDFGVPDVLWNADTQELLIANIYNPHYNLEIVDSSGKTLWREERHSGDYFIKKIDATLLETANRVVVDITPMGGAKLYFSLK